MAGWVETKSGILLPAQRERTRTAVDLFCGCGGFSLGADAAGIDVVAAVDNDPAAVWSYLYNLGSPRGCAVGYVTEHDRKAFAQRVGEKKSPGGVITSDPRWIGRGRMNSERAADRGCRAMIIGDATAVTGPRILDTLAAAGWRGTIDAVIGGPPCQGISQSNSRAREDDPRNNLVLEFVRIAAELGAAVWVMENVPPLVKSARFRPLFDALVERAHAAGYNVAATVLDAVNYGVPQWRRRAFITGTRPGAPPFRFPMPSTWTFVSRVGEGVVCDYFAKRAKQTPAGFHAEYQQDPPPQAPPESEQPPAHARQGLLFGAVE